MKIEKKVLPEFFQKIVSGEKNFDLRLADFDCKPGDTLVLKEYDPKTEQYTGKSVEKVITYVAKVDATKFYSKGDINEYGLQIISFRP